jgi:membrane protease YdiL (CAAX protease family)
MSDPAPVVPPQESAEPFWTYQDLVLFAGMALPSLLAGAILVQLFGYVAPGILHGKGPRALIAQFLGYGFLFGSLYLLLKVRYGRPFWVSMAWVPWRGKMQTLLAGPLLAFCIALLGVAMRTPEIEMPFKEFLNDRASVILIGIFATTLGPMCEELAFRGFLMPLLRKSFGVVPSILGAALPFALLHGPQYAWSWRHVLLVMVAGVAFGVVRYRTGSTAAATVVHGAYNLTQFVAFLIQERPV